jgi:hypothetical protein
LFCPVRQQTVDAIGCRIAPGLRPGCNHHIGAAPTDASEVYSVLAPAMPISDEKNAARCEIL